MYDLSERCGANLGIVHKDIEEKLEHVGRSFSRCWSPALYGCRH